MLYISWYSAVCGDKSKLVDCKMIVILHDAGELFTKGASVKLLAGKLDVGIQARTEGGFGRFGRTALLKKGPQFTL